MLHVQDFQQPMGDRRQELVCIGCDVRRPELVAALDACLVTEAELAPGHPPLPDPFAEWPRCVQHPCLLQCTLSASNPLLESCVAC